MGQQGSHPHLLTQPQQVVGDKHRNKHRRDRVADKLQQRIQGAGFRHIQFGEGFHQHQADGQQDGKQRGTQRRQGMLLPHVQV
ncbi:hypothetical protein D3C79_940880 [compost metagenome]